MEAGASRALGQFCFDNDATARFRDDAAKAGIAIPIMPGIMPTTTFRGVERMAARCGASIPAWLARAYDGLDEDVETPPHRRRRRAGRPGAAIARLGFDQFHFYTLNQANLSYAACRLAGIETQGIVMSCDPQRPSSPGCSRKRKKRLLLLDGSWGVMIQGFKLGEDDFRGPRFGNHPSELKGNNDLLTLTKPEIIRDIGRQYLEAGADFIETNTFNSNFTSQEDYGLGHLVGELNEAGARLARELCDQYATAERPRLVAGVLGPANRTATISPDVNDPAFRNITFDRSARHLSRRRRGA